MAALKQIKLIQALALFDEKSSLDYGLALWAAFFEVESLYKLSGVSIEYRRFYIAPSVPSSGIFESLLHKLGYVLPGGQVVRALELLSQDQIRSSAAPSTQLGDPTQRAYDQEKLTRVIRDLVDPDGSDSHLMIVTDRLIKPPSNWRYIIWEENPNLNASVISVAPLDPNYWRDRDPDRVMTIKHRMRCAAISITGELSGLHRCENESCFLFDDVASVTVLDGMREIGEEHGDRFIAGAGFDDNVKDPTTLQSVTRDSTTMR